MIPTLRPKRKQAQAQEKFNKESRKPEKEDEEMD